MEPIECSETSAFSTQMPGRHPNENALHIKHGESLKSRILVTLSCMLLKNPNVINIMQIVIK